MSEQDNNISEEQNVLEKNQDCSKETLEVVKRIFDEFNRAHLLEYIELVNSPKKLFWLNFFSGLAKGLGLTIGTAIVLTILFKITQHIVELNIPYITAWVSEWISEISALLHAGK